MNDERRMIEAKNVLDTLNEKALRPHLVRIARVVNDRPPTNSDLSGGGILLQTETGGKGVLTAEHCLSDFLGHGWKSMEVMILCTDAPGNPNVAGTPVPLANVTAMRGHNELTTPDIAWIPLHSSDAALLERHGATFIRPWRKQTPIETHNEDINKKRMWLLTAVHGWFAAQEQQLSVRKYGMFAQLEMLNDWAPPTPVQQDAEGWDYADYVFDDGDSPRHRERSGEIPEELDLETNLSEASRGGYSGCPVWRMWKTEHAEEWEYTLTGMAIYQYDRDEKGERKLRVHREKSIARIIDNKAPPYYRISHQGVE